MALREINFGVKVFGSDKENVMKLKEYEIYLQLLYNDRDTDCNSCSNFAKYLLTRSWSVI